MDSLYCTLETNTPLLKKFSIKKFFLKKPFFLFPPLDHLVYPLEYVQHILKTTKHRNFYLEIEVARS